MLLLCIFILVCLLLYLNYRENFQNLADNSVMSGRVAGISAISAAEQSIKRDLAKRRNEQLYSSANAVHSTGYQLACNELTAKRNFLYMYIKNLSAQVNDLSSSMVSTYNMKDLNMTYQDIVRGYCSKHVSLDKNDDCINLASVDGGPTGAFAVLPDIDSFYTQILLNEYDIYSLYAKLNYYTAILGCSSNDLHGIPLELDPNDISLNQFDENGNPIIANEIGKIDTETLALNLERLSPYYLSPDVVKFLLKFLISQEELKNLNETSAQYLAGQSLLINKIIGGAYYKI